MTRIAAIFDVDRTLLDGMSGAMFTGFLWKQGALPFYNRFRVAATVAGYRLGLKPESNLVEVGVTCYSGLSVPDLADLAEKCVQEKVGKRIFTEAAKAVADHNRAGDYTILASGSNDFIVTALAHAVGAKGVAASAAVVNNALSTRQVNYPLCYKEGKLELVSRILTKQEIDLENCHLYSDNDVDLPIFHKVKYRHAVNPDEILLAEAKKNGWEILTWNTPRDPSYRVSGSSWPVKERVKR